MTKKLEEILNLPESKKIVKQEEKSAKKAELAQPLFAAWMSLIKFQQPCQQSKG